MRLERIEQGMVRVLGERTDIVLSSESLVELVVERIGPLHIITMDGAMLFQANDSTFSGHGVGFFTWAMDSALLYDLEVTHSGGP